MKIKPNRTPYEFFETKGGGSSPLEAHAGAMHHALHMATISDYNILTYSSVIPKDAVLIKKEDGKGQPFGSELYCIAAICNGEESEILAAGVSYGGLYDKNNEKIGGLAVEVSGCYPEDELIYRLETVLRDLHEKTYNQYELRDLRYITARHIPQERYGCVISALCFVSFKSEE